MLGEYSESNFARFQPKAIPTFELNDSRASKVFSTRLRCGFGSPLKVSTRLSVFP